MTTSHDADLTRGSEMEVDIKVRPPVDPPGGSGGGEPEHHSIPVLDPLAHAVSEGAHDVVHGIEKAGSGIKHGASHAAGWWTDQWQAAGRDPAAVRGLEYAGLAVIAVAGVAVAAG